MIISSLLLICLIRHRCFCSSCLTPPHEKASNYIIKFGWVALEVRQGATSTLGKSKGSSRWTHPSMQDLQPKPLEARTIQSMRLFQIHAFPYIAQESLRRNGVGVDVMSSKNFGWDTTARMTDSEKQDSVSSNVFDAMCFRWLLTRKKLASTFSDSRPYFGYPRSVGVFLNNLWFRVKFFTITKINGIFWFW